MYVFNRGMSIIGRLNFKQKYDINWHVDSLYPDEVILQTRGCIHD